MIRYNFEGPIFTPVDGRREWRRAGHRSERKGRFSMKNKRLLAALTACACVVSLFAGCGTGSDGGSAAADPGAQGGADAGAAPAAPAAVQKFHVWSTGSDNVRQIYEKLIEDFNKNSEYAGKYEAELQFILAGTGGAELRNMLVIADQANQTNTDYDVVELGDEDIPYCMDMVGIDMFEKLDMSKLPNAARVSAKPVLGEGYVQPFRGTTVILAYNSETVPENEVPKTMDELVEWIKAHPGRFAYNSAGTGGAGDSFIRTAIYNLIDDDAALMSSDPKWMDQWDAGFEFLKDLHPYMYKSGNAVVYPNKNQGTLDLLSQGEIDMCPNWADMVLSQRKAGTVPEKIKITTITPSFTGSVCCYGIPTFSSNKDAGYAWINYMLTDQAQTLLVQDMAAIPLVDASNLDLSGVEDLMNLDVSSFRTQSLGTLTTELDARWDEEISMMG